MANRRTNKVTKKVSRRSREEMPELESGRDDQEFNRKDNDRRDVGGRSSGRGAEAINFRGDYKDILRELAASPTVRYVAGGIATALLTRLANNWAEKYPEISTFIRDNIGTLEGKLGSSRDLGDSNSRH